MASALVDELVRSGMTEAVLAPGSRSAPLAFALHAADAEGRLRLHVRIDERSAGFLALGLAKVSGRAVAVVTTSGTAAANLHPAVLEADESGVPLLLLTADRPPELRATGANQTVDQIKLYGTSVRLFHEVGVPAGRPGDNAYWRALACRAVATALGVTTGRPGPVHLNLALSEPLVPTVRAAASESIEPMVGRPGGEPWTTFNQAARVAPPADAWPERTLVVAGDATREQGEAVVRLAEARGWPVVAEPSSGARSGPNALRSGNLVLGVEAWLAAHLPERVLVVGRPTLHRSVTALLCRGDVRVEVVRTPAGWADATRTAAAVHDAVPEQAGHRPVIDDAWLAAWRAADGAASAAATRVLDAEPADGPPGACIAAELHAALPSGSFLLAGSSMSVRDLSYAVPRDGVGVQSGRGTSGIDGTVSTAIGSALAWQTGGGGRAFALVGDLTFLHDQNGLILGPAEARPDLTIVVVNNDGGAIFSLLEQGSADFSPVYERVFGTPHGVDLAAVCGATSTPHTRVSTTQELVDAVLDPRGGLQVVEVRTGRSADRELAGRIRTAVETALSADAATA